MLAPIVYVSALGFNVVVNAFTNADPSSKLLTLRGGAIETEPLVNAVSALNVANGALAWLAPKKNLEMYGVKAATDDDIFLTRSTSAIQIALAVALLAGKGGFDKATLVFMYGHAIQCLACVPIMENLSRSVATRSLIGSGLMFAVLAEVTRLGVLKPSHLSNVAILFYTLISASEILMPKAVLEAFGFTKPSALTKMMMGTYSAVKLQVGAYLLVSKCTGNPGFALAGVMTVGVLNCVRAALSADEIGFKKAGPLGWAVVQGAIGLLAYKAASA